MKKIYAEPDFELVNIRLTADVLQGSTDEEGKIPDVGGDDEWDEGDFDFGT